MSIQIGVTFVILTQQNIAQPINTINGTEQNWQEDVLLFDHLIYGISDH